MAPDGCAPIYFLSQCVGMSCYTPCTKFNTPLSVTVTKRQTAYVKLMQNNQHKCFQIPKAMLKTPKMAP